MTETKVKIAGVIEDKLNRIRAYHTDSWGRSSILVILVTLVVLNTSYAIGDDISPSDLQIYKNFKYYEFSSCDTLNELNDHQEAIKFFKGITLTDTSNAKEWNNKGVAFALSSKYDDATNCFDRAIKIDSSASKYYNNKGNVLAELGKYEDALKYYEKALQKNGSNEITLYNKGFVLGKLGCYDEAVICYDEANQNKSYNSESLPYRMF